MKIHAAIESGKVIGTAQFPERGRRGSPFGGRLTPLPGQEIHVLDLPANLCSPKSQEDIARLHEECEKCIREGTSKYEGAPSVDRRPTRKVKKSGKGK
jgi:hypothetical protein